MSRQRTASQGSPLKLLRSVATVLLLWAALPLQAQTAGDATDLDVEPPVVELEQIASGQAGVRQIFTARVTDDRQIAEVLIFYRFAGEATFENMPMRATGGSSVYSATIPTGSGDSRDIEYYIQARDEAGNRVIKGYAFSPLVRSMGGDTVAVEDVPAEGPRIRRRWLYEGIGVVAVGALAAYLSSRNDNGGRGDNVFTLTVETPEGFE